MVGVASRVAAAALAVAVWADSANVGGAVPVSSFTTGSCVEYPADGYCATVGLGGAQVFVFGSATAADIPARDAALEAHSAALQAAASAVAGPDCINNYMLLQCYGWFPPCDPTGTPLKPCKSSCESTYLKCQVAMDLAVSLDMGGSVPQCDTDTVGELPRTEMLTMLNHYLTGWAGEPIWEAETYTTVDVANGGTTTAQCASTEGLNFTATCGGNKKCRAPLLYSQWPKYKDPSSFLPVFANPDDIEYCNDVSQFDCERCDAHCSIPCPYPLVYDETTLAAQHNWQMVPGVLAFPLNTLVLISETAKLRQKKKTNMGDRLVQLSAVMALLLFVLEGLPTAILGKEVRCAGEPSIVKAGNFYGNGFCEVGQFRHWVLIGLMSTVVCNLWKVRRQLKAAAEMKKYAPSKLERAGFVWLIFGMPVVLACAAVLANPPNVRLLHESMPYRKTIFGSDPAYLTHYESLWHPNNLRGMYACQFFFSSPALEYAFYVIPLLMVGFFAAALSIDLLRQVNRMNTTGQSISKNKSLYTLAINMLRFAFVVIVLVLLNAAATLSYLPKAIDFGLNLNRWSTCLSTGINQDDLDNANGTLAEVQLDLSLNATIATCGHPGEWAPSAWMLQLLAASQSLPPFFFGMVFAWPSLRQLTKIIKNKMHSVVPLNSSMASSTE